MSAATIERRSSLARVPAAFRLQFAVPTTFITVPLIVFFSAWAVAIGIGLWLGRVRPEGPWTAADSFYAGASQAALWCLVIMAAMAGSHTYSFAMALSFSRRVYLLGAVLAFAAISFAYGAVFAVAAWIEEITEGYGQHVYTFALPYLTSEHGSVGAGLLAAVLCLTLMLVGFMVVMIYRRFGLLGTWSVIIAIVVLAAVSALLVTQFGSWARLWAWFVDQTSLSLSGWLLIPITAFTLLSYLLIRKATPST